MAEGAEPVIFGCVTWKLRQQKIDGLDKFRSDDPCKKLITSKTFRIIFGSTLKNCKTSYCHFCFETEWSAERTECMREKRLLHRTFEKVEIYSSKNGFCRHQMVKFDCTRVIYPPYGIHFLGTIECTFPACRKKRVLQNGLQKWVTSRGIWPWPGAIKLGHLQSMKAILSK